MQTLRMLSVVVTDEAGQTRGIDFHAPPLDAGADGAAQHVWVDEVLALMKMRLPLEDLARSIAGPDPVLPAHAPRAA